MKVVFLNLYSGINNRGAESFAHELAHQLSSQHQVTFISGADVNIPGVENITVGVNASDPQQGFGFGLINDLRKRFFLDSGSVTTLRFSLRASTFLKSGNFDLIIPMNGFWQLLICKIITIFTGGKTMITGHSGPGWDERWNLYLHPDIFIATTGPTAQWARKVCPWTRVATIPYGIDIAKFRKAKPVSLSIEKPIILCPAAAVPYKRIDLAIKAVARMEKGSLLHLGNGPLKNTLTDMGNNLLGSKRFVSLSVPYVDIPRYYAACDLVTLPSSPQENSPMVFLESLASGKFVVTTNAPRSRWTLGDAGVFVDPTDIDAYTNALTNALKIKDFHANNERVTFFTWDKILKEYEKVISELQ